MCTQTHAKSIFTKETPQHFISYRVLVAINLSPSFTTARTVFSINHPALNTVLEMALNKSLLPKFISCKTVKTSTTLQRFLYFSVQSSFIRSPASNPSVSRVYNPTITQSCQAPWHLLVRKHTFSSISLWELIVQAPCSKHKSLEPWTKPQTSAAVRLPQMRWFFESGLSRLLVLLLCLYSAARWVYTNCSWIQKPCTTWDHGCSLADYMETTEPYLDNEGNSQFYTEVVSSMWPLISESPHNAVFWAMTLCSFYFNHWGKEK